MDFAEELASHTGFIVERAYLREHGDDRAGVYIRLVPSVA